MQEAFGIRDENVFKAASGLHGGFGGRGDICGSVLGASLMIGLMCGSSIEESGKLQEHSGPPVGPPELDAPTKLVGEIYDWFGREFGSVKCETIRGKHEKEVDAAPDARNLTEEERMGRVHAKCDELCGKTAARTVELLWNAIEEAKKK